MNLTSTQLATLRLARTTGVGGVTFLKLLARCGSAEAAVEQLPALCKQFKRKVLTPPSEAEIQPEIDAITAAGGTLVCYGDEAYPELLTHLADPPVVLTVLGDATLLSTPQLAIVGNRNASAAGAKFTADLAQELTEAGFTITSGLARGVDTAAHQGALRQGSTIAVVAGGADHIYPPENKDLHAQIAAHGCVVSEQPWSTQPTGRHFPRRNRIIAGLSLACLVTEASRHSGSLITAQNAGDYGRDVFAVPGSPADPRAAGPNHLLKQGASPLTEAADILNVITPNHLPTPSAKVAYTRETEDLFTATETAAAAEPEIAAPTEPREIILSLLSSAPIGLDEVIRQSQLPEADVRICLTTLELTGQVERHPDGRLSKT